MKTIFTSKEISIDQTPILIKEIKSIGQLITYTSFNEVVADTTIKTKGSAFVNTFNRFTPVPILPSADKQLVIIGRGKILAGINLSLLTDSGVTVKNDSVWVDLPAVQILDAILNPSDFETFVEKGEWSNNEVILVKAKARRKMIAHAIQQNILPKADAKAKMIMENFLHNMGYKHVEVF
ncbi:DUF4230 domain-containing protein [Segetibacter sp.]|uniref:DUF4230 domain-containing protein n=1 Tax=Segetibacter sp. TaxID=2231182 RepID=UPI00261042A2|nr:DUF4230 domain-containing protein [Segetibacter sp.]